MLRPVRVAVDRLAGEIGRIVKLRRGVPRGNSGVAECAPPERNARAQGDIAVLVIERQDAVGGVTPCSYCESAQTTGGRRIGVDIQRMIRPTPRAYGSAPFAPSASRKDLNDPAHSVGTVEDAGRAADGLDPI